MNEPTAPTASILSPETDADEEAWISSSLHGMPVTTGNWRRDKRGQMRRLISFREIFPCARPLPSPPASPTSQVVELKPEAPGACVVSAPMTDELDPEQQHCEHIARAFVERLHNNRDVLADLTILIRHERGQARRAQLAKLRDPNGRVARISLLEAQLARVKKLPANWRSAAIGTDEPYVEIWNDFACALEEALRGAP